MAKAGKWIHGSFPVKKKKNCLSEWKYVKQSLKSENILLYFYFIDKQQKFYKVIFEQFVNLSVLYISNALLKTVF